MEYLPTKIEGFRLRKAEKEDIGIILEFIRALAEYERMSSEVVATEELLNEWLFGKSKAEVLIAEFNDRHIGFALFFHNFSTFLGRAGIYLEDLFINPEYRGRGFGKETLRALAELAVKRGCGRLEWACLKWNEPSISFYHSLGAKEMSEWTTFRISGDKLREFAE